MRVLVISWITFVVLSTGLVIKLVSNDDKYKQELNLITEHSNHFIKIICGNAVRQEIGPKPGLNISFNDMKITSSGPIYLIKGTAYTIPPAQPFSAKWEIELNTSSHVPEYVRIEE